MRCKNASCGQIATLQVEIRRVPEYDPMSDVWVKKTDMPTATNSIGTCTVNGKIYAIGGSTNKIPGQGWTVLSTLYEYNPATDKWEKKDDMPTARWALASAVLNGVIYAVGGWNQNGSLPTLEAYYTKINIRELSQLNYVRTQGDWAAAWSES